MKKVFSLFTFIFLIFSLISCELFYSEVPEGTIRLITIALDYTDNPELNSPLLATENDAQGLEDSFRALGNKTNTKVEVISMIQNQDGITGLYPNKENILNTLKTINSTPYDKTIIYFSGHGVGIGNYEEDNSRVVLGPKGFELPRNLLVDDSFYFVTGNENSSDIFLSGAELIDALKTVEGATAVIVDSCHSGAITRSVSYGLDTSQREVSGGELLGTLGNNEYSNKTQILASSRLGEYSLETRDVNGIYHGVFTLSLINGLSIENGIPAASNGKITLSSLYKYAKDNDGYSSQLPQISSGLVDLVLFQL